MKLGLFVTCCALVFFSASGYGQGKTDCSEVGAGEQKLLSELDGILKNSVPAYEQFPLDGFFVYDLTDTKKFYRSPAGSYRRYGCIRFVEGHVYHFSPVELRFSRSHIAFFENGKFKVFYNVNCDGSQDDIERVISYAREKRRALRDWPDILGNIKNYRKYGFYLNVDDFEFKCRVE